MRKISYAGYRFPPEVIHQAIWLYLRFTLSFRDVEDLLAERGIVLSYETVRRWVLRRSAEHFRPLAIEVDQLFGDGLALGRIGVQDFWRATSSQDRRQFPSEIEAILHGDVHALSGKRQGRGLALPFADTEAMQLHLEEISRNVAVGAHAVLLFDRAGWHTTPNLVMPENITPIWLPSRAPELNPVENVWQYLRQTWLSNRVFETYDDIVDAACES